MLNNFTNSGGDSLKFIGSNRDFPKFIGGNEDALKLNSSVLSKVESFKAKSFLKLLKSYSLLILILSSS